MRTFRMKDVERIEKLLVDNKTVESEEDMLQITVANNMVYSESLGEMIIKGFYMKKKN